MAGYIMKNNPSGTPSEMAFGTLKTNVPAMIDLIASIGGVSAKSEMWSALPIAIPTAMLNKTKNGRRRKSSSLASSFPRFIFR